MDPHSLSPASTARLQAALERTYITKEQAALACEIHEKVLALGLHAKPIEEILFEKEMITRTQCEMLAEVTAEPARPPGEIEVGTVDDVPAGPRPTVHVARIDVDDATRRASETAGGTRMDLSQPTRGKLPVREIAGFRLLERVGAGTNGTVYKAIQVSMNRAVALKILSQRLAKNTRFVERFLREARVAAKLNHPNIIGGIDVGEESGLYYFAMEFADGRTVREMLERGGALDERQSLNIVLQIARGLDQAYRHGLIHRDIKPDNIIIANNQVAKLLDLGLARQTGEASQEAGKTFGTPNYISPEQARGDAVIDTRSDIYSLGATLYHMLCGQTPFQGNPAIVMAKHISEPPRPLGNLVQNLNPATLELVDTMMAKDPNERHQSPQELIDHLEGALDRLDPVKVAAAKQPSVRRRRRRLR